MKLIIDIKLIFCFVCCIVLCNSAYTQDIDAVDSISMEICTTIRSNSQLTDDEIMNLLKKEHFFPFMKKFNSTEEGLNIVLLRLENLCPEYSAISHRTNDNKGDWVLLNRKPFSILDEISCAQFFEHKKYYYLEPNGKRVRLEFKDGYWIDKFIDNTYSKLKIIEKTNCEFVIQFEESNNYMRSNFSRVGDKYEYQILSFEEDKYFMSVKIGGQNQYYRFILYLEK